MAASWFTEHVTPHDAHRHELKKTIIETKTAFQRAVLADSYTFGRVLILDDEIQSAQRDEFIYHEALVQPAMTLHPGPRDVLILGGGEGATVREILRHASVQSVTMVDIDEEVVDFCKKYLGSWHQGALQSPKTHLVIADAKRYIAQTRRQFDIIIADLPTPTRLSGRPGKDPIRELYSLAFYRRLVSCLRPGGMVAVQSGSGNAVKIGFHAGLRARLEQIFRVVRPYYAFVPSFDEPWAFLLASQKADPRVLTARQVDRRLGTMSRKLRFYDGETHEGLFRIPKYLRGQRI